MLAQVLAIIIFLAMFLLIILEIWERQWITLACGLLTLLLVFGLGMHSMGAIMRTLNLQSFFTTGFWYAAGESSEASSGINWQTIIFIAGMMIMVEGMAKVGFFRWLCMEIAKMVKYQVIPIFMTFISYWLCSSTVSPLSCFWQQLRSNCHSFWSLIRFR